MFRCAAWFIMNAGRLNAMTISGETVSTLGILVARIRLSVFIVGSLLTGVMVVFRVLSNSLG